MNDVKKLQQLIDNAKNIVFFGGAGVSTESGIKDFRSKDGLYNMKYKFNPEEILSHHFFVNNPIEFYEFYKDKLNPMGIKENVIHKYLVELEKVGKLKAIITQNIDNLHTLAGSKCVLELHGNVMRNYCVKCHKFYDGNYVFNSKGVPYCECGGIIKPDVVLYEEALDDKVVNDAIDMIKEADLLIVAGTSLLVYPAAGLVNYFEGKDLVIINRDITKYDSNASLVINCNMADVFKKLHV